MSESIDDPPLAITETGKPYKFPIFIFYIQTSFSEITSILTKPENVR